MFNCKKYVQMVLIAFYATVAHAAITAIPPVNHAQDAVATLPTQTDEIPTKAGIVTPGAMLKKVEPKYPWLAKAAHIQGTVILHATITKEGKIANLVIVSSPDKILSKPALKAAQQWTDRPYLLNGEPIEVDTTIKITFTGDK